MKFSKAALGVGAACAACCAVPVAGTLGALATGATTLATVGASLLPCADELAPLAGTLMLLAAAAAGAALWRRQRLRKMTPASTCGGGCRVSAD